MTIIGNGERYTQVGFATPKEFEDAVLASSKALFGGSAVYVDAKKIDAAALGGATPAGFVLDLATPSSPSFSVVAVELVARGFFNHIFPRVTRLFALLKNSSLQKLLVAATLLRRRSRRVARGVAEDGLGAVRYRQVHGRRRGIEPDNRTGDRRPRR